MNVAIIGCNGMGSHHARMAENCGLRVVLCADTQEPIARKLADTYGADFTTDAHAAVTRADIDIVAIMTPTPTHTPYVIEAARAGKHVFCEKPFGRTVEQCKEAMAAARKAGIKLFIAHVLRYFQEYEAIRAQIEAGKVGKPGFVKLYRGGGFPTGINGWFRDYAQSGGVAFDSMIHDLDWLRYVFGEPERIFCQTLQRSTPDHVDYAMATVRMKSGLIAKVVGTWAQPSGFRVEAEVCGDKGMIQYNSDDAPVVTAKRNVGGPGSGMVIPSSPVSVSPYELEWRDFLSWIEGKSATRVSPEDGLAAVRMAAAALKSAETGKPVNL